MNLPTKLPIHFKLPGRSYSQLGRKGNVALYSVYSDYSLDRKTSWPYVLLGFELVVIKIKNNCEVYPGNWEFGKTAWSIPKSFPRVSRTRLRFSGFREPELRILGPSSFPDRSSFTQELEDLAAVPEKTDQTASEAPPERHQRRVALGKNQIKNPPQRGGGGHRGACYCHRAPFRSPGKNFQV